MSSIGSVTLSEITYKVTNFTIGWLISTRGNFLWQFFNVVTEGQWIKQSYSRTYCMSKWLLKLILEEIYCTLDDSNLLNYILKMHHRNLQT